MVRGPPVPGTTLGILKRMWLGASVGMNPPLPSHVKKSSQVFTVGSVGQRNNCDVLVLQAMKSLLTTTMCPFIGCTAVWQQHWFLRQWGFVSQLRISCKWDVRIFFSLFLTDMVWYPRQWAYSLIIPNINVRHPWSKLVFVCYTSSF